ncbi:TraB/GumN family protein [Massilia niabensis]|uniref:TraB/GumN family protein n=1 Tax=Massilia niabensis TaxID=544910 RepID=A0ABW0L180_9BURK
MFKHVLPALALCFLSLPAWSQTGIPSTPHAAAVEEAEPVPQTVLVTGSRPGPGLWKVSKGENVMWVFGTYAPLPPNMEWRSRNVEKVIANSQEYLKPPASSAGVGVMGGLGALPFLIGFKKNPDGAELKDVLLPDVYARWLPLKQQYFGNDDDIARERPIFVAEQLSQRAMKAAGLGGRSYDVRKTIEKLVDKHKIKTTSSLHRVDIKDPAKTLREFKKSPMDDAACLVQTMARLDTNIEVMRARANAWAVGELDEIRKLDFSDRDACYDAVNASSLAKNQPELKDMKIMAEEKWIANAEKALATNTSTFAVVEIRDILDPKGIIATLQAKGYTVESPK